MRPVIVSVLCRWWDGNQNGMDIWMVEQDNGFIRTMHCLHTHIRTFIIPCSGRLRINVHSMRVASSFSLWSLLLLISDMSLISNSRMGGNTVVVWFFFGGGLRGGI